MKNKRFSLPLKMGSIILIALLLLIPTAMIHSIIDDRMTRQNEAMEEVSSSWSFEQTITGPFLTIPYTYYTQVEEDKVKKTVANRGHIQLLPEALNVESELFPERRHRGIYEVVLYNSKLHIKGNFNTTYFTELEINPNDIHWDKASLQLGISDLRGLEKQVLIEFNGQKYDFNPGLESTQVVDTGLTSRVPLTGAANETLPFALELELKGSQGLHFNPVGKITDVNMQAPWNNPKFSGAFITDANQVTEQGFTANWNVLHLNRTYPQLWVNQSHDIANSTFGVDLKLPVDAYLKSYRAVEYAILFIALTFMAFFFMEVLNKVNIHPFSYILVGLALVLFFTLLLSISEHIGFNKAYILAALATILLVTLYLKAIVRSAKMALQVGGLLVVLYAFIYVLIQLQDFALLVGSIGLFVILATVMYLSRSINWSESYNENLTNP